MKKYFFLIALLAFVTNGLSLTIENLDITSYEKPIEHVDGCTEHIFTYTTEDCDGNIVTTCTSYVECDSEEELDDYESSNTDPCWDGNNIPF